MKQVNKTIALAALLLAAAGLAASAPALAQGEDAAEAEIAEVQDDAGEVAECADDADDVDCLNEVEAEPANAEAPLAEPAIEADVAPMPGAVADAPAEGGMVVVPGSTDESQPGGSTRPGTTPDN